MSDYDSSIDSDDNRPPLADQKLPFRHDYYLTNSLDIFDHWKTNLQQSTLQTAPSKIQYLQQQFAIVRRVTKFRTAEIIRVRAFIHILKGAFEGLQERLVNTYADNKQEKKSIEEVHKSALLLEKELSTLLVYLQELVDLKMLQYYSEPDPANIETYFASLLAKVYPYLTNINLLWHVSCCQSQLSQERFHSISLGGNLPYYQNIVRSILKRNWQLKEVYDRLAVELKGESYQKMGESQFLSKVIWQVLGLQSTQRLTDKDKMEFIDCLKGLYFLSINLRSHSLLNQYLLTSFHLDLLFVHNMFIGYEELQDLFVRMLSNCRKDPTVCEHTFAIEIDKLPFEKRSKVPQIEELIVDITHNYIAVSKHLLSPQKTFPQIKPIPLSQAYTSTEYMLEAGNVNMLVGLMMCMQDNSKDAFSLGDLSVHKIYLHLSDLIKQIYLSYQHDHWLFPSAVLLYIPLVYLMEESDELKSDIKKALFTMVQTINQDKMPVKLVRDESTKGYTSQAISRSEYLQVIIFFLEACRTHQQYINLPQIIPSNLQTSILYIKSLELKLNNKEPTPDQMPYVLNMLKTCEQYKLTINFKWFTSKESIEDRQIEFNIEKGLGQDWARKIYRNCINQREALQIKNHFERYQKNQLSVINLANILKYCHGLGPGKEIPRKSIRQQDLFTLLEQIKMLFAIRFDIFDLNLDEQISLNYIHVCLGLYNSCYDETPFNEAYMMIMDNVMRPYLAHPGATLTTFKSKYPSFFQKWLYSFQIGAIFHQLGTYISEKGQDNACRQDIINKIRYVRQLIDNKENITQTIKIEELTQIIVIFSTLINRQAHPQVYIQCVELFCLFLNSFPEVRKDVSIEFMVDGDLLQNGELVSQILKHIKNNPEPYLPDAISILNTMVQKIPEYMQAVGLKKTNQILILYYTKNDSQFKPLLSQLQDRLYKEKEEQPTFLLNVLRLVLTLKKQTEQEKKGETVDQIGDKVAMVREAMEKVKSKGEKEKEELHLCEIIFMEDIICKIDKKYEQISGSKGNVMARDLFHKVVKEHGTNEDRIYFAQKLDFYDFILNNNQGPIDSRQKVILTALLVESKYKGNEVQLIKKILRQSKKLSEVASAAIDQLRKTPDKIQSHHLNKLIHINNRYPSEKIESFIIEYIGCERNHAPVKIKQAYLVKDLVRRLDKLPKNVCEELMFKPFRSQEEQKIIEFSSNIFEKLLYLPISKFEKVNLNAVEQIHEENQDWNTQSDPDETKGEVSKVQSKEEDQMSQKDEDLMDLVNDIEENNDENNDDEDDDRPNIVDMFINQGMEKERHLYEKYMLVREQLDVLINSQYGELTKIINNDKEVSSKVRECVQLLNNLEKDSTNEIITRTPEGLYKAMRENGLKAEISQEMREKMQKRRKIVTKPPKWRVQLFSDREESDDSNIVDEDDDSVQYYEDDEDEEIEMEEDENIISDDDSQDSQEEYPQKRQKPKKSPSKNRQSPTKAKKIELPGLVPTYSKIEEQISGHQLKREEIIKILELSLYWLLKLPQSQIRSKQITAYYMDILHSNLGQIFFQSTMTAMRIQQTSSNLEWLIRKIKEQNGQAKGFVQIGLQQISMQNAINNVLYLIKQYQSQQEEREDKQAKGNILFKQSHVLLPIAEQLLTKLDLPIQNNCLTLLFIYIATNKSKIRKKIDNLSYALTGSQLPESKKEYKLKHSQMMRIIESICKGGNSNNVWENISNMNLKVKEVPKLFGCLRGYGNHLYGRLLLTGEKIMKTIKIGEGEESHHHSLERTYHIVNKLVTSVKDRIKQFYFINKSNLKTLMEDELDDIQDEMENLKKIPKKLKQNKSRIFNNKELIRLVEVVVYFIKILKDQFYGKIQQKLFNKLVQYPKMILEATWYYIFIFAKEQDYVWRKPSEIQMFFNKYPHIGSYAFGNLQEVFGVIVYFLNLEPFCTDKFKQFFLPILMKNQALSRQITLRFKIPKINEDEDYYSQTILVTRKCSFDMAFYQVTGRNLQVEFHEEEGSDHGGLVRELMIGWKGRGVGEEAFFIGKILGISFKQGVPYGGTLDVGMFVAITNFKINLDFFKQYDPQIYRSLNYIQNNDPQPLSLKFVIERTINGKLIEFQLIEEGRKVDLIQSNKDRYIQRYMEMYFYAGREQELAELKLGFNTVVYPQYAQIFTPVEMMRQIKGEEVVDVKMLISKANYEGYSAQSAVIRWLWAIVETFDQQTMNTFIQFVTGSPKITVYNSNFSITIEKVYEIQCLPVAHTCFNTIDLPEYSSKQILEKKLMTAIYEGNNSFGIL